MSSLNISGEALGELLQCSLCLAQYEAPTALKCLHTFCAPCIEQHVKLVQRHGLHGYDCPYCRTFSPQTETKPNFHMTQLLTLYNESKVVKLCALCEEREAEWKCQQCVDYLCTKCKDSHLKLRALRHHKMLGLNEIENSFALDKPVSCDKHVDKMLEYNCTQCDTMLCITCALLDHKGHNQETIDSALKRYVPEIKEQLETFRQLSKQSKVHPDEIKDLETEINSKCDESVKDAKAQRDLLINKISAGYVDTEQKLIEIKNTEIAKLHEEIKKRASSSSAIDVIVSCSESALNTSRDASLLREIRTKLLPRMREVEHAAKTCVTLTELGYPTFKANNVNRISVTTLGRVQRVTLSTGRWARTPAHATSLETSYRHVNVAFEQVLTNESVLLKAINIKSSKYQVPFKIIYTPSKIAVCYSNGIFDIFTSQGDLVKEVCLMEFCGYTLSAAFVDETQLAIATANGLYVSDLERGGTECIIKGRCSDVYAHRNHLYAHECHARKIHKFSQQSGAWELENSFVLYVSNGINTSFTFIVTDEHIFVQGQWRSVQKLSHDGTKLCDIRGSSNRLYAVNKEDQCLVRYNPLGRENCSPPHVCVSSHGNESKKVRIPGVSRVYDILFVDKTFWILEQDGGAYGLVYLKHFAQRDV